MFCRVPALLSAASSGDVTARSVAAKLVELQPDLKPFSDPDAQEATFPLLELCEQLVKAYEQGLPTPPPPQSKKKNKNKQISKQDQDVYEFVSRILQDKYSKGDIKKFVKGFEKRSITTMDELPAAVTAWLEKCTDGTSKAMLERLRNALANSASPQNIGAAQANVRAAREQVAETEAVAREKADALSTAQAILRDDETLFQQALDSSRAEGKEGGDDVAYEALRSAAKKVTSAESDADTAARALQEAKDNLAQAELQLQPFLNLPTPPTQLALPSTDKTTAFTYRIDDETALEKQIDQWEKSLSTASVLGATGKDMDLLAEFIAKMRDQVAAAAAAGQPEVMSWWLPHLLAELENAGKKECENRVIPVPIYYLNKGFSRSKLEEGGGDDRMTEEQQYYWNKLNF